MTMCYLSFCLSSVPGSSPVNVESEVLSSTSIRVSWEEVSSIDQNGIIMMYEVLFEPLETFGDIVIPSTINTTLFGVVATDLRAYVNYNISVRAYTSVGAGPYSDPISNRTREEGTNCTKVVLLVVIVIKIPSKYIVIVCCFLFLIVMVFILCMQLPTLTMLQE